MSIQHNIMKALAVASVAVATPAAAEPILFDAGSVGDSYSISFDGFSGNGGASLTGLSSALTLTLTSVANGVYSFAYSITNTGSTTDSVGSRVSGFAFDTAPDISSATSNGIFGNAIVGGKYPNGIQSVDVCFQDGGKACAGGGNGGVFDGETGTGNLNLKFSGGTPATLTLDDFFVRYQSVSGLGNIGSASGRETSSSSSGSSSGGTEVPEPSMMLLFGLATLGLIVGTRRRGKAAPAVRTQVAYA